MPLHHFVRCRQIVLFAFVVALVGSARAQSPSPAPSPASPEAAASLGLGTTTPVRAVSLRAAPNGDAPVIGTLHPGDPLEILATANYGWTEVRSPAGTGWAYGSYLALGVNAAAGMSGNAVPASTSMPAGGTPQEIISP